MTETQPVIPNEAETLAIAPVAPEPLEQQPVNPATSWNPPGGTDDFDSLFQRIGVDGENIVNSNTVPTEPTTENPEEPAPQQAQTQTPVESKFTPVKTKTGSVYNTLDDMVKGVEAKDTTIEQLRSMIAAVTGEDPLSKAGIKPGPTSVPQKPVSYLADSRRYAEDLQKAAELGQQSGNWDTYRNVQAQLQYEVVQSAVGPYMPVVQNVGKQQALETVSKAVPGFRDFYGSQDYQKVLEQRPKLAGYIKTLEGNATMQEDLAEQYLDAWNDHQVKRLAELASKPSPAPQNPTPRTPLSSPRTPDFKQEPNDGMRRATRPTEKTLATTAGRKAWIEELERKGIADVNF